MTNKDTMPKEIQVSPCGDNLYAAKENGKWKNQQSYIRKDPDTIILSRKELEGMLVNEDSAETIQEVRRFVERNDTINKILEMGND